MNKNTTVTVGLEPSSMRGHMSSGPCVCIPGIRQGAGVEGLAWTGLCPVFLCLAPKASHKPLAPYVSQWELFVLLTQFCNLCISTLCLLHVYRYPVARLESESVFPWLSLSIPHPLTAGGGGIVNTCCSCRLSRSQGFLCSISLALMTRTLF